MAVRILEVLERGSLQGGGVCIADLDSLLENGHPNASDVLQNCLSEELKQNIPVGKVVRSQDGARSVTSQKPMMMHVKTCYQRSKASASVSVPLIACIDCLFCSVVLDWRSHEAKNAGALNGCYLNFKHSYCGGIRFCLYL